MGVLVDSVGEHIAGAEERGIEIDEVVDAPNTLAVFVWGPDRVKLEYVEHKPSFSLSWTRLDVAGAGMAGLVAAAQARQLGAEAVVHEKGNRAGGSMLLSSGVVPGGTLLVRRVSRGVPRR